MSIPTREQFRRSLGNSPMAREADGIYDAAMRGGINPAFVAGLAAAESSYGTAGYARGTFNPFGLGVHLGWRFPNYAKATEKLAQTLRGNGYPGLFKQRGLAGIISRYTPASDGNDEGQHFRNIVSYGGKTGGDARQVYITPGAAPAAGATPGATPSNTVAGGLNTKILMDLMRQQTERIKSGQGYDRALGTKIRETVIGQIGKQNVGGGRVDPTAPQDAIAPGGAQPKLSKWGGPEDHGSRALGNWQSDMAYDLGGPTGTPVRSPLPGRVVKISGQPGGNPQFAGYGVTVDFGGGRQAFFKHVGTLGPGVRPGAQLQRGSLIGGLDPKTGGGPHLHLGANSRGFLQSLLSYYGAT